MPLVRMIVAYRDTAATPVRDGFSNTLYFNVSGSVDPPDYQDLVDDLFTIQQSTTWCAGRYLDIRAYNMDDPEPRPIKAQKQGLAAGTKVYGPPQIALALSYYADRNLPRQRGRIFLGPFTFTGESITNQRPTSGQQNGVIAYGQALAGLGGLNVDWSLYSPSNDTHTRISNIWCDNSWDVIRSRKLPGTGRVEASING